MPCVAKGASLSLLFKFILSVQLSNSLWGSNVPLFLEFINIVSISFYNFVEFIILLYTFLVTSFSLYKECMIYLILFSKFSDVLPTFTCTRGIGNLWRICSGVNILVPFSFFCFLKSRIFSAILTIRLDFHSQYLFSNNNVS